MSQPPSPELNSPDPHLDDKKLQAVIELINLAQVSIAFQPIVDLKTRKILGYESLLRCREPLFNGAEDLVNSAVLAGRVGELGRLSRGLAVKECPNWPLFINIHPNEFAYGWLVRPDDPIFRHRYRVFLEITESVPLNYFEQCQSVLAEIRKKGALLVIDDLGAGYSNLKYIAELAPQIVKLDRELVAAAEPGTRHFRLIKAIVHLCKEMEAKVVAEGVETREELSAVIQAGADFAQGYLFARPANPPPEVVWPEA